MSDTDTTIVEDFSPAPVEPADADPEPQPETPPVEPEQQPAEPQQPETPPEPKEPEAPAEPQQAVTRQPAPAPRDQVEIDFAELESVDPIDDPAKFRAAHAKAIRSLHEGYQRLAEQNQQLSAEHQFWNRFEQEHPGLTRAQGQKLFEKETQAVRSRHPDWDESAIAAAATDRWHERIGTMNKPTTNTPTPTPTRPAAPAAPVTRGGARVTPSSGARTAPAKPKDPLEAAREGAYGDLGVKD